MLLEIAGKIVSSDIFKRKFVCDLTACKGICCVEGDSGAPLKFEEIDELEDALDLIKPFMQPAGIDAVEETGVFYMDEDNEPVTTLIDGAACAFSFQDETGITKCAIERAYKEGKIDFNKPISCHLYPIRIKQFHEQEALTYDEWPICAPACSCGEELNVPVYKFLKEPLVRVYGEEFYTELSEAAEAFLAKFP